MTDIVLNDDWTTVFGAFGELAETIANTAFVPAALRKDKASITAALLQGRELGLQPMASLQHIHVIEGRPTLSAQSMRAIVLARGHSIEVVESTSELCRIKGKRASDKTWTETRFTIQEANKANLTRKSNWQAYAKDMLFARATSRLCRMIFPDVIGGISYTPEDIAEEIATTEVEEPTPVIRRKAVKEVETVEVAEIEAPKPQASQVVETEAYEPPLSFEDEEIVEVEPVAMITEAQLRKLMVQFKALEISSRAQRIAECAAIIGREILSSKEMTKDEASQVIEHFESLLEGDR
jgi:hypothetical protein